MFSLMLLLTVGCKTYHPPRAVDYDATLREAEEAYVSLADAAYEVYGLGSDADIEAFDEMLLDLCALPDEIERR